jgi:hypothetical protein
MIIEAYKLCKELDEKSSEAEFSVLSDELVDISELIYKNEDYKY